MLASRPPETFSVVKRQPRSKRPIAPFAPKPKRIYLPFRTVRFYERRPIRFSGAHLGWQVELLRLHPGGVNRVPDEVLAMRQGGRSSRADRRW